MKKSIISNICWAVITVLVFLVVISNFGIANVVGTSMLPSYKDKDLVLYSKSVSDIDRCEVVAIDSNVMGYTLCKRVIGLSGDHIVINDDGLYVNDKLIEEDYLLSQEWEEPMDLNVSGGCVFVMGDNRNGSTDSRDIGCIMKENIRGVALVNVTEKLWINSETIIYVLIIMWCLVLVWFIKEHLHHR